MDEGHYYSCIRVTDQWFMFDDSKVYPVDEQVVLKELAYILFYAKKELFWCKDAIPAQPVQDDDRFLRSPHNLSTRVGNFDSTGFIKPVLQCLMHTVPFFEGFISKDSSLQCMCSKRNSCLVCHLKELYSSCNAGMKSYTPDLVARTVKYLSSNFQLCQHEDGYGLFLKLLFNLKMCDKANAHDQTLMQHIFGGKVHEEYNCLKCKDPFNTCYTTSDVFYMQLHVDKVCNLHTALEEAYTDRNIYSCRYCSKEQARRVISLHSAPEIFTLHLKRFNNTGKKKQERVSCPLALDLLRYATTSNDELKYELYSMEWYRFHNSEVSKVDESEVRQQQPHILLYAKHDAPWLLDIIGAQQRIIDGPVLPVGIPPSAISKHSP
ncbi:ubiquitinyl hydrolase 1 [Salvia divinorum]|uniref:ubiquitinyl hydrolase 1 n=1 Tax=Salvia divinorum TaxID=28513 RepID=A0ABD1HI71_SALDI